MCFPVLEQLNKNIRQLQNFGNYFETRKVAETNNKPIKFNAPYATFQIQKVILMPVIDNHKSQKYLSESVIIVL